MRSPEGYQSLATDVSPLTTVEEKEGEDPKRKPKPLVRYPSTLSSVWIYGACLLSLVCTLLNLAIPLPRVATQGVDETLRLVRPYVGLDRVASHDSSSNHTLQNFAKFVAQLDHSKSPLELVHSGHTIQTFQGSVYTDERQIVVNRRTSTIVQFRVQDYDLETCRLVISLPTMVSTNLTYDLGDFTQQELTVWELDAPQRLKPDTRQPPRRKQIAWKTVVSDGSYETSPSFPCISGTHLAFELTCASRKHECHVNFWQDGMKLSPLVGFFMLQT